MLNLKSGRVLAFLVFGLSVVMYVAVGFITKPAFEHNKNHKGDYVIRVTKPVLELLQAFSVIYWILLAITVAQVSIKGLDIRANGDRPGSLIVHTILLGLLIVNAVAMGYLTRQVWSNHAKHVTAHTHGKHELVFTGTERVLIQILVVLTWVQLGLLVIGNISVLGIGQKRSIPHTLSHGGVPGLTQP